MSKETRRSEAWNTMPRGSPVKLKWFLRRSKNQRDLSLAYSPGVAEPCKEIAANRENVYKYTAKGNLVAVISNGTAVLGLGDIGPEASKQSWKKSGTV